MGIDERAERREQEAYERGLLEGATVLFEMVDDLDLALVALTDADAPEMVSAGLVLSRERIINRFTLIGFETIDPLDVAFDPHLHQAVAVDPFAIAPGGTVCVVQRRGWRRGQLVVRPAMVTVSAAAAEPSTEEPRPFPRRPMAVADLAGADALSTVLESEEPDDELAVRQQTRRQVEPTGRRRRRGVNDIFGLSRVRPS